MNTFIIGLSIGIGLVGLVAGYVVTGIVFLGFGLVCLSLVAKRKMKE